MMAGERPRARVHAEERHGGRRARGNGDEGTDKRVGMS